MNKQELFEKALNEFEEWPYDEGSMIYCIRDCALYKAGDFSNYHECNDSVLGTTHWKFVCTRDEFEAAKAKRKLAKEIFSNITGEQARKIMGAYSNAEREKPIYTKEMQERGELLVVGMEVEVYTDQDKNQTMRGEVVHIGQSFGEQKYTVQCQNWLQIFDLDWVLPIDTRTAKEKAIDGVMSVFDSNKSYGTEDIRAALNVLCNKLKGDENEK